jgi:hypothetical protein
LNRDLEGLKTAGGPTVVFKMPMKEFAESIARIDQSKIEQLYGHKLALNY